MAVPVITFGARFAARSGNTPMGVIHGSAVHASYDTAHPAVTALTGKFRSTTGLIVVAGASSNGWAMQWDVATSSFKAFGSNGAAPAALVEAPNTTNIGTFHFHAIGRI